MKSSALNGIECKIPYKSHPIPIPLIHLSYPRFRLNLKNKHNLQIEVSRYLGQLDILLIICFKTELHVCAKATKQSLVPFTNAQIRNVCVTEYITNEQTKLNQIDTNTKKRYFPPQPKSGLRKSNEWKIPPDIKLSTTYRGHKWNLKKNEQFVTYTVRTRKHTQTCSILNRILARSLIWS